MLSVERVTCGYGGRPVLFDVSFCIEAGELWGIIGPNGSGKSTLLRVISRVLDIDQGAVKWRGRDMAMIPVDMLAREVAVVSQSQPAVDMTVEEFVFLGRIPYAGKFQLFENKKDHAAVEKALVLTGADCFRNRLLEQMSGGERQLVFIARALAQEPKLLLLDEPTTHLDIAHQVQILDLVRRLNRELGLTVVMILHDLNLAGEYCEKLLLLDSGRVYTQGTPKDVLTYQIIENVYKTVVLVEKNPVSSRPCIFLVSEEERRRAAECPKED